MISVKVSLVVCRTLRSLDFRKDAILRKTDDIWRCMIFSGSFCRSLTTARATGARISSVFSPADISAVKRCRSSLIPWKETPSNHKSPRTTKGSLFSWNGVLYPLNYNTQIHGHESDPAPVISNSYYYFCDHATVSTTFPGVIYNHLAAIKKPIVPTPKKKQ